MKKDKKIVLTLFSMLLVAMMSYGGVLSARDLKLGMVLEPPHLDPTAGAAAAIDEVVYANLFEGLTTIASDGSIQPALASDWIISSDGLTYTFILRPGVKFHDGTEFDSADVVFSLDRARGEDSANAQKALFSAIESVSASGQYKVVIKLSRQEGNLLFNLGWGDAVIVNKESAASNKTNPIGTGPFQFVSWDKGDKVTLKKSDNYWGKSVNLDRAIFKFISDPSAALASMLSEDIDAFPNFPSVENVPLFQKDTRFTVVIGSTEGETILSINNESAVFKNKKARQALAHAIDSQAIIDGAMFGLGTPIGSHFAPHHPAYEDLVSLYDYNPEKAKKLLKEAGIKQGQKVRLHLPPPAYARRGGEIIASQLRDVGLDIEIIPVEWAQWLKQVFKGTNYDLTIVSHTEPMDIGIYGRDKYYFNYKSADFRALLKKLNATTDTQARYAILQQMQKKIANDSVNVFLFQLAKVGVWNKSLKGLWHNSPVQANNVTDVSWQ